MPQYSIHAHQLWRLPPTWLSLRLSAGLACLSSVAVMNSPSRDNRKTAVIPESVSFGVAALARRWGAKVVGRSRMPDDLVKLQVAAATAADVSDVVVVIGGASAGEKDFAKDMFAPLGLEFIFNKVAIKPGKPVWMGRLGRRIVVGLPGNPTSALVTARLFLAPLLAGMAGGGTANALAWRKLRLTAPIGACDQREKFLRARRDANEATPLSNQDSAAQKAIADSDLLIQRRTWKLRRYNRAMKFTQPSG